MLPMEIKTFFEANAALEPKLILNKPKPKLVSVHVSASATGTFYPLF